MICGAVGSFGLEQLSVNTFRVAQSLPSTQLLESLGALFPVEGKPFFNDEQEFSPGLPNWRECRSAVIDHFYEAQDT